MGLEEYIESHNLGSSTFNASELAAAVALVRSEFEKDTGEEENGVEDDGEEEGGEENAGEKE